MAVNLVLPEAAWEGFGASAGGVPGPNSSGAAAAASDVGSGDSPAPRAYGPLSLGTLAAVARVPEMVVDAFLASLGAKLEDDATDFLFVGADDLEASLSTSLIQGATPSPIQRAGHQVYR